MPLVVTCPTHVHRLLLATLVALSLTGGAATAQGGDRPPGPTGGQDEPPAATARQRELSLRFAWPRSLEARVVYRRVAARTGSSQRVFTARYTEKATRLRDEIRVATSGTRWEGEIPYPPGEVRSAIRASEAVIQRVDPEGAFIGLQNQDALRPVMQRIYEAAGLSNDESEQAIARVEAGMVEEARAGWNLAVGFWIGAELDFGRAWEKEEEASVWLLPTLAVKSRVRIEARRRVPCSASERRARCVELTLHSEPDLAGLAALTRAIVAKLSEVEGSLPPGAIREVGLATDLTLVTEPETLVPHRVVWRRAVRATVADEEEGARELEDVERTEWSWSYVRRAAAAR